MTVVVVAAPGIVSALQPLVVYSLALVARMVMVVPLTETEPAAPLVLSPAVSTR